MATGITWKGMDKLKAALEKDLKMDAVKKIMRVNGSELQTKTMRRAPVKTGNLKRSIVLNMEDEGLAARVSVGASYGPYVEYGTRFMNAKPYLRPSFNEQKVQLKHDLERLTR